MNQARTTYQSDFTPFDWLQNNCISDMSEFCSSENIDECLKYISQEFCALGYPSISSNSNDYSFTVNCDIVKFLNATFELLRSYNEHTQSKEDLESRNQRLSADLNALSKKNSQLKNNLVLNERKLASALERDRQLKEKNEQLSQLLKVEKEETKKLTAQIRQQKVAYQHEIRKYENNLNHIKAKLNQLLSDKNPNKRIANITTSHTLQRNSGQRGKWKTGTSATTAMEDMYNSVISSYETCSKDLYKVLNLSRQCLQSVFSQIGEIVSGLQNDNVDSNTCFTPYDEFVLNEFKSESKNFQAVEEKFRYLLSILKEEVSQWALEKNTNLDQINVLKLKVAEYEKILEKCRVSQSDESQCIANGNIAIDKEVIEKSVAAAEFIKKEKMKLEKEKQALSKTIEIIEKEKTEISSQKLAILRLAMQHKTPPSSWHHTLKTSPSISVITSHNGSSRISGENQLKFSLSLPDQIGQMQSPQWISTEQIIDKTLHSKSDSKLLNENKSTTQPSLSSSPPANLKFSNSDLPSWAVKKSEVQTIVIDEIPNTPSEISQNISMEGIDQLNESSSEEINLLRLRTAIQDIEQRRNNIS